MIAALNFEILIREPAGAYHGKSKDFLTSHLLAYFRKCPFLYARQKMGFIEDVDRPAYLVGRGGHTLTLEGRDRFEDEFAVGGPINPSTGKPYGSNTKAWAEWAEAVGKPVLTQEQFDLICQMSHSVHSHPIAQELLAEGVAEGVVRTDYCGMPCQIRMDWLNPERGIVDLKTCDDLTWFQQDAKRYGYVYQMAFCRVAVLVHIP